METNEQQAVQLSLEVKKRLEEFKDLQKNVDIKDSVLNERMATHVELFLKEIKNISLISVTAAPFSLTILQTQLSINVILLVISFTVFLINVLILNIGVWYINNEFLRSNASQKLETVAMSLSAMELNSTSEDTTKRVNALFSFFESEDKLKNKKDLEPYKLIRIVDKIRFIGIILLSSAILLLVASIVLPIFIVSIKP